MLALNRLAKQGLIASPARGFYAIVPPEYRALGCLPAEQFVPDLMQRLRRRYYVSLLSAAEFHGAAHQRPQALQVFLESQRRPIACGRVRVTFLVRKRLGEVPVQTVNTPRGGVIVSTPEATALDLVGYEQQAGGLNLVATVLSELAERIDAQKLAAAAKAAPIVWAQRVGHLLQHLGAGDKTGPLQEHVGANAQKATPLGAWAAISSEPSRRYLEGLRERHGRGGPVIPRDYVTEWRSEAPWVRNDQVEQDLVISRALVDIFSHPSLQNAVAFRGGTALYKLHLRPAARYSEDIDLVQTKAEAAGPMMHALREILDPWLGVPKWKQTEGRVTFVYRFDSEDAPARLLRVKVEINTREHFSVFGLKRMPYAVKCRWFDGACEINTYELDELLGTKLRALYQRKAGRDLFDLAVALGNAEPIQHKVDVACGRPCGAGRATGSGRPLAQPIGTCSSRLACSDFWCCSRRMDASLEMTGRFECPVGTERFEGASGSRRWSDVRVSRSRPPDHVASG